MNGSTPSPGPGRRSTRDERRRHLVKVAHLFSQEHTASEIADRLGVTRQQISYDLKILRRYWLGASIADYDEGVRRELAKIDLLEREAWEQWHESKGGRERTSSKRVTAEGGEIERTEAKIDRVTGTGDTRHLQVVQWCISKRCEILGLNAPRKIAPTSPDGRKPYGAGIELKDALRILERYGRLEDCE